MSATDYGHKITFISPAISTGGSETNRKSVLPQKVSVTNNFTVLAITFKHIKVSNWS
ncbi:hypothetical protein [Nostoc sp.]|uniref:hypothetical protein n=1 Tax=Nostoc sp. TaxID=1180 RepID=UPI002FF7B524